jgi:hypothetical protein
LANVKQTIKVGKERIIPTRMQQDVETMINKLIAGKTMNVYKFTETRDLNPTTATLTNVANVLATLIDDLRKKGIIGD